MVGGSSAADTYYNRLFVCFQRDRYLVHARLPVHLVLAGLPLRVSGGKAEENPGKDRCGASKNLPDDPGA